MHLGENDTEALRGKQEKNIQGIHFECFWVFFHQCKTIFFFTLSKQSYSVHFPFCLFVCFLVRFIFLCSCNTNLTISALLTHVKKKHIKYMKKSKLTWKKTWKLLVLFRTRGSCCWASSGWNYFYCAADAPRTLLHSDDIHLISMNLLRTHHCHWQPLWNSADAYLSHVGVNSCSKSAKIHLTEEALTVLSLMHVRHGDCFLSSAHCWTPVKAATLCTLVLIWGFSLQDHDQYVFPDKLLSSVEDMLF